VYNWTADHFNETGKINVPSLDESWFLTALPSESSLYISDSGFKSPTAIHRVSVLGNELDFSKFPEKGPKPYGVFGLFVTKRNTLLVSVRDMKQIKEYAMDGTLIKQVQLDDSFYGLQQAVELSTGNYVVAHQGLGQNRVCVLNTTGSVVKCYGGENGAQIGPTCVAVDANDKILVADSSNDKVFVLDSNMQRLGDIVLPAVIQVPWRLCLDQVNSRLFISESIGGGRLFVIGG